MEALLLTAQRSECWSVTGVYGIFSVCITQCDVCMSGRVIFAAGLLMQALLEALLV